MNYGELQEDLRLLLQESEAEDYEDDRIRTLVLMGLRRLFRYIRAVNPEAIISIYTADIIDASSDPDRLKIYNWPDGTIKPLNVRYKATGETTYALLPLIPAYYLTLDRTLRPQSDLSWAPWGHGFFALDPPPEAAVDDGLLVEVVENPSLSASSDVPTIDLGLHEAIPLLAKRRALFETGQVLSPEEKQNLADLIAEIPRIYEPASGGKSVIVPVVNKAY